VLCPETLTSPRDRTKGRSNPRRLWLKWSAFQQKIWSWVWKKISMSRRNVWPSAAI